MPRATWGDLKRFCRRQQYDERQGDHLFFDRGLPDGSSSGTMVSHGVRDTDPIPKTLWKRIWHEQLRLRGEADFWSGAEGGSVTWDIPPTSLPATPLLAYLQRFLRERHHYSEEEIAQLAHEEAQALYDAYRSREGPDG